MLYVYFMIKESQNMNKTNTNKPLMCFYKCAFKNLSKQTNFIYIINFILVLNTFIQKTIRQPSSFY